MSSLNYPGGHALAELHRRETAAGVVHIDSAVAQAGVSRFLERPGWRYSKDEARDLDETAFTHLLRWHSAAPPSPAELFHKKFETLGFDHVELALGSWPPLRVVQVPKVVCWAVLAE